MRRVFLGNFDFEHQLASEVYAASGGGTPALNLQLACCWISVAADGDQIYLPGSITSEFMTDLKTAGLPEVEWISAWPRHEEAARSEFVPWGWSEAAAKLADAQGFTANTPDLAAVKTVNSRSFSFACEREWGLSLPGSRRVENMEELEAAVAELPLQQAREPAWVLKANFSMSARERMLARGTGVKNPVRDWAKKRFAYQQPLFLEPWVQRSAEAGLQFEIPQQGDPEFLGIAVLLCDDRGQYRGSRICIDAQTRETWQPAIEVGHRVALRVQQAGYFGPLGIDAMQYRDDRGELQWRPVQDVNARYTMGRLALGFTRLLNAGQVASWLHFPWKESYGQPFSKWLRCVADAQQSGTRWIATSPDQINGQTLHLVNGLLISETTEDLYRAEETLMRAVSALAETSC
ncbi:MAG: hypothetical protein CME31_26265 [Gimesia sp.]|uniref:ATP-grasp domain-containing protein n=1 Tax=Gimesia maris TaxID=122 RepID=A0A3D3R3X1_9PLAN|nr:hypothetical protein [Gimesia sp.]HCO22792.1 hypothetical protein [Gimesia maris]|tara:strand:- start:32106 stop:33323 length:1218 start_codon:yes stop_codon:yes gene_type:complete